MAVIQCLADEFEGFVIESGAPCVIAFLSQHAEPCQGLLEMLRAVSQPLEDKVRILAVDVDQSPTLAERLGVSGVPTFLAYQDGLETNRRVASCRRNELEDWIGASLKFD